jgi:hypothetical protein
MSQMINDTLQNVYNRLAMMGKTITEFQTKLDDLNKNLNTKVQKLTETIASMTENTKKEGDANMIVLQNAGKNFLTEISKLQSNIGLKDFTELTEKLKKISDASKESLKPENVDLLLDEVLKSLKALTGAAKAESEKEQSSGQPPIQQSQGPKME